MRLPSHLLTKLSLAGLAVAAACERADEAPRAIEIIEDTTFDEAARTSHAPAVAPRYAPPRQQQLEKKKRPRKIWTSICGGAPQLYDADAALVDCGKG